MNMMKLVAEGMDVAEVCSPPRVATHARAFGLRPGWSLDITNHDHGGEPWDFSKPKMRERIRKKIQRDKPLLIIGSPMCTDWSTMMNLNWPRMSEDQINSRMKAARMHLKSCIQIYRHQAKNSRYFLHEHPSAAGSWKEPNMRRLIQMQDSIPTKADQCQYGLLVEDAVGKALSKKPTTCLTNSPCIASKLRRTCEGAHTHIPMEGMPVYSGA